MPKSKLQKWFVDYLAAVVMRAGPLHRNEKKSDWDWTKRPVGF